MHACAATVGDQLADRRIRGRVLWQSLRQLPDHVAEPMDLLLAHDMAEAAAGELDVLLPASHLPDRLRRRPVRLPQIDREDQAVAPRIVVEDDLDRRVRIDAAIPIELAFDLDRRKCRRQGAGGHHMRDAEIHVPAVEIPHAAAPDVHRANGQANRLAIDIGDVDQLAQRLHQGIGQVIGGLSRPGGIVDAERGLRVRLEEARHAACHGVHVGKGIAEDREPVGPGMGSMADAIPEFLEACQALGRRIAGDEGRVDGAYGGADDPVGFDPRLAEAVIDAGLIGAKRAPALQHQHRLADGLRLAPQGRHLAGLRGHRAGHVHAASPCARLSVPSSRRPPAGRPR